MKHLAILLLGLATFAVADDVQDVIEANNAFSPDMYKELYQNSKPNYVVSTSSAFLGLSMLLSGSNRETKHQISDALKVPSKYESGIETLLKSMKGRNYTLNLANGMFIDKAYPVADAYIKKMKDIYHAYVNSEFNFADQKVVSTNINKWVAEKTNKTINTVIDPTEITDHTKAILLNVVHFEADWDDAFSAGETKPLPFYPTASQHQKVNTMVKQVTCKYAENKELDAKFLELPFVGKDSSIVIALPNQINGIDNFEKEIGKVLGSQNFKEENVKVYLPKFKVEQVIDFKAALAQLGVTDVFDSTKADLSGIVGNAGDIHLEKFRQKVSISLNEHGVNAAAGKVPSLVIETSTTDVLQGGIEFNANHPFLYFIKIRNVVAFVGRIRDPSK